MADWRELLTSGDVDAVRRMLKHGAAADTTKEAAHPPPSRSVDPHQKVGGLFADRMQLKIKIGSLDPLSISSYRTMGKVLWPAGHAVANLLAGHSAHQTSHEACLLEFGAGCAVPSLVAAVTGRYQTVVSTDCFEENVQLIKYNSELNGECLTAAVRLDVAEHPMLASIVQDHGMHTKPLLLVACDMSYDPEAVTNLFASADELMRRCPTASPMILFARSDNFAHLDEHTAGAARAHGLRLISRREVVAPGIQDAIGEAHLTPCAEDGVTLFFWAPADCSAQEAAFRGLVTGEDAAVHPRETASSADVAEDEWAPVARGVSSLRDNSRHF